MLSMAITGKAARINWDAMTAIAEPNAPMDGIRVIFKMTLIIKMKISILTLVR